MRKYFTLFITSIFCIACSNTNKNIYKEVAIPNLEQFQNCTEYGEVKNNFRQFRCSEKDLFTEFPLISEDELHLTFTLFKSVNEISNFSFYKTYQMYLSCNNKEVSNRLVDSKEIRNGETIDLDNIEISEGMKKKYKLKSYNKKHEKMIMVYRENCPVREGYERIAANQYDFKNLIKKGNYRNISVFDGWDDEYTMTLDCKKLLLGINGPPKVAITPKSLGEEVFKKAC